MKLHRLFIWLLAIGYGVLVYANEENAPSAHDPFALRQEALRDFESGKAEDAQYNSAIVAYNYHSVASAYYSFVDSMDLAIQHGWGAIHGLEQIADFMCLEAASVYTVRYRIRKKMGSEHPFPY